MLAGQQCNAVAVVLVAEVLVEVAAAAAAAAVVTVVAAAAVATAAKAEELSVKFVEPAVLQELVAGLAVVVEQ